MYCITSHIWDRPTRDCCTLSQRQNGYSVVPEHPHVGPHGPNRASFFMNPMYSIARTRQCPRKSCSPRQPMAAYMWNGLQPVTSFTLIPNPNPNPKGGNCTSSQFLNTFGTGRQGRPTGIPTSKRLFSCARAPTRGTSWTESGILFYEPDILHSSYPAMSSQILFTTTAYGCLHVERITAYPFFYTYTYPYPYD